MESSDLSDLKPQIIVVDEETWDKLQEMLAAPPAPSPKLRALLARKASWED